MNILLYRWKVFNQEDIKEAFEEFGHNVTEMESPTFPKKGEASDLIPYFEGYDAVFTVNFFIEVSEACESLHIKYICWTVDSPMLTMYDNSVFNECNYIFVFDKVCFATFKAMGVKRIWYLPLAVNTARLDRQLAGLTDADRAQFSSQISFVGGLYDKNSYDDIYSVLPDYLAGYFDCALQAQGDLFGDNVFDRIFTPDIIEKLSEFVNFEKSDSSLSDIALIFNNTFLGYKHAQISRIKLINMLAAHFNSSRKAYINCTDTPGEAVHNPLPSSHVHTPDNNSDYNRAHTGNTISRTGIDIYTDKDDPRLIGVNYRGTVDYLHDMPKVFRLSSININLTMCNIRSGIPLRVWDILGAGGFALTNYQSEIPLMFENGKDIVYYESFDDCLRKADYYLNHEDERLEIAKNGHDKAAKYHSYTARVKSILETVGKY